MPWVDGVYVMPGGTDPPGLFDRWPEDTYGECIDPLCDECPRKRRRRQAAPPAFKRNQAVSPKATKDDRPTLVESSSISNNRAGTSSSPLPFARPERTHLRPWLLEASRIVSEGCEQQERLPCEIASWLFIGDVATAASVEILKALKVTHVLNAAGATTACETECAAAGAKYKQLDSEDVDGYAMLAIHWADAWQFVQEACASPCGRLLVYGRAGLSRGALLAIAALMLQSQMSVLDALRHGVRRGHILRNEAFRASLIELAAQEGLLGPAPCPEGLMTTEPPCTSTGSETKH
jgi:hypothetical protein